MTLKIDEKLEEKLTFAFKNEMRNFANFHRLKNSDFILENKIAELNQNKNLKQLDRPDAVRKHICFGNEGIAQLTKLFTHVLQNRCFKVIRKFPRKL